MLVAVSMFSSGFSGGKTSATITVTPWCDNSMRIRISPTNLPPAAQAARAALEKTLADKNISDLSAAMIDSCGPGSPSALSAGGSLKYQNLAVHASSDGLSFSRVDTGEKLFSAAASFTYNGGLETTSSEWKTFPDQIAGGCSGSEYDGSLGSADSAADCLSKVVDARGSGSRIDYAVWRGDSNKGCFVCDLSDRGDPSTWKLLDQKGAACFEGPPLPSLGAGYYTANLSVAAGNAHEVVYGLGQGNWTDEGGCPAKGLAGARIVPLERNGQRVNLQQRKFHVSIPFVYSTAGYGFLFNMPGYGDVAVGGHGVGGAEWSAHAALYLDFWVSALPSGVAAAGAGAGDAIYAQYADATGHAPPIREDALAFWQSRNRYKSSAIALDVARRYAAIEPPLDVGVLVIDYKNQLRDGDFAPNPACYPDVRALSDGVREAVNATTMFSFWPEVLASSPEYAVLDAHGCLINSDLGGRAVDATVPQCRALIWSTMLKPRYYDKGVDAYWLDETDGEGTGGGGDGDYGYNTSYGPAPAYSNLWVNDWLSLFSAPVAAQPAQTEPPLVLTRGAWAGGQRHGIVLWSSDIHSSFEQLASQVPQGVHASMSGIPWWTTDVGGYGCGETHDNNGAYMRELIVRWYQFGCFSPVFRTHGCRQGPSEPDDDTCKPAQGSCGFNEVWSYGDATQATLEKYVRLRATLKPYLRELGRNVSARGVPTMRPLAYEFPADARCAGIDDQFLLGPRILVAPVTAQNATTRAMYFPAGASWQSLLHKDQPPIEGGQALTVDAPLDEIPVYTRV